MWKLFFGASKPFTCLYMNFLLCFSVSGQDLVWQLHIAQAEYSEAKADVVSKHAFYCDYLHGPSSSLEVSIFFKPESISDDVQLNKTMSACIPFVSSKFLKTLKTPLALQVFNVNGKMSSFNCTLCLGAAVARPLVLSRRPQ